MAFLVSSVSVGGCCASGMNSYTEAQWTADQPGYAPAVGYDLVGVSGSTPVNLQGMQLDPGRIVTISNVGTQPITIVNESPSATTASMRIDTPQGANLVLMPGDVVTVRADPSTATTPRVRVLTTTTAQAPIAGGRTLTGGTASGDKLTLDSTTAATSGGVWLAPGDWLTVGAIAAPANPPSGYGSIYWDSTANKPYAKDSTGTVYDLTAVGGGGAAGAFAQTASVTVTGTLTETTLTGAGAGSLTLPANYFAVGSSVRITAGGPAVSLGVLSATMTLKVKVGALVLTLGPIGNFGGAMSGPWRIDAVVTCRTTGASGTLQGSGWYSESGSFGQAVAFADVSQAVATTGTLTVDLTATHSNTGNSIQLTTLVVTRIY